MATKKVETSRLGNKPIQIPAGVEVKLEGRTVKVKGAKGTLSKPLPPSTSISIEGSNLSVKTDGSHDNCKAFHGLAWALIRNMIQGVTKGFLKELLLEGVGFRAKVEGKKLVLSIGFSHPVELPIPEGLKVEVGGKKQEEIVITGADREVLGEWVAKVRKSRPPEPYKGKGIRYKGEHVKLKAGKRVGA